MTYAALEAAVMQLVERDPTGFMSGPLRFAGPGIISVVHVRAAFTSKMIRMPRISQYLRIALNI
jgi:hypothetical protein